MRNVWSNAREIGQMLSTFDQFRTPNFKPAAVDELGNAFGEREAGMPRDTQLGGTSAMHFMVSRRRVSRQ